MAQLKACQWLYKHVQLDHGAVCLSDDLYEHYLQDIGLPEESEDAVSESLFKMLLNKIYNVNTSQTRSDSKLIYVYRGISYVPNPSPGFNMMDIQDLPDNWFIMCKSKETIRLGTETNIVVSGLNIIKVVEISENNEVFVKVGSHVVQPLDIGLPDTFWKTFSVRDYLQVIDQAQICLGKEVPIDTKCSVTCEVQGLKTQRRTSKSCSVLLNIMSRGQLCRNCQFMKVQKQQQPTDPSNHLEEDVGPTPSRLPEEEMEQNLEALFPNGNDILMEFIRAQSLICQDELLGRDHRTRRWEKRIISLCLSLWIASPLAYRILSKTFYLPTERTLRAYKNSVDKEPGINRNMLKWMSMECERTQTPKCGGLIFDEMFIQAGVQMEPCGEGLKMFGFVDHGENNNGINESLKGGKGVQIATAVLQFVFLSFNGFRFPFAYFLTKGLVAGELTTLIWDIINQLKRAGFKICYICMDGASVNRSLLKQICGPSSSFGKNIAYVNSTISCIMDVSHVIKKIRNSVYSSGEYPSQKRWLTTPSGTIIWKYFLNAYNWDKSGHQLRIHRRLTADHFILNSTLKMRNFLAEQVLNSDMLLLMQSYQKTLENPNELNGVVQFLEHTSQFIDAYRSSEPVTSVHDERLLKLAAVLGYFVDWNDACKSKGKQDKDPFITRECFEDLQSCINGFIHLCHDQLPSQPIIPKFINSDVCENVFCQQRAKFGGANSHPDASQYR